MTEPIQRESMEYDVVIVGGGPAGLAAAIRLKQLAVEAGRELSVCLLEKGSEIGAHILSGAVLDPIALNALIPDWRQKGAPLDTPVSDDRFYYLTRKGHVRLPNFAMPALMNNHGMEIVSLGRLCQWLGKQAESLGVEIYPGFAAADVVYGNDGEVKGVVTGEFGVGKDGRRKSTFTPGLELHGQFTLFAEGACGSLSKQIITKFDLQRGREPQKYGLGVKELWELEPGSHKRGLAMHTLGWPLDNKTGGGLFMYHYGDRLCAVGLVVHLNYENPHLSPFEEFQRAKQHPLIRRYLEGGKRIGYGARVVSEGGLQSVPALTFPGGALIGCSAGFMNVPRIKGAHNAMQSGMLAAESVFAALKDDGFNNALIAYEERYSTSPIVADLKPVRNVKPLWSRFGTLPGLAFGGLDMWTHQLLGCSFFGTLGHGKADADTMKPARMARAIAYPKPDLTLSFDRSSSLYLSGTNHEEDQPVHLRLLDSSVPLRINAPEYDEPAQRYCPAGVYEFAGLGDDLRFQINAQNCLHCKTCEIKDPSHNIIWNPPEGGGGPSYSGM